MRTAFRSWWHHLVPRRRVPLTRSDRRRRPWLEHLEERTLFTLSATSLPFTAFQTAHTAGFLATANQFDLYAVSLGAGDTINAAVSAQATSSGLLSVLRVFDAAGRPLALDSQEGGDPRLTFQTLTAGDYVIGVSSAGDDAYDPSAAGSGHGGATTGLYALDVTRTPGTALKTDLAGSSFRLATGTTAAWGDTVSGTFTLEDRGGANAGAFAVDVVLSNNHQFDSTSLPHWTVASLAELAAGQSYSGHFTIVLPNQPTGFDPSGPVSLGLRIDPAAALPEATPHDQSGVHRGEDWEALTIVTLVPPGVTDLSQVDPGLNTRASGTLQGAGPGDTYAFTITPAMGSGRLTAEVAATTGRLVPRLTLTGPDGRVLIQSDDGIVQYLEPGTYALSVTAASATGSYRLVSAFVQASAPFESVGQRPWRLAVADVNGDGSPDLISTQLFSSTVEVFLGNGDGTFQPQRTFAINRSPYSVAAADVNGDGKPDLVVATYTGICVLLGNGDGTFQTQQTFAAGSVPYSVAVADVNGDGKPDLVVANAGAFVSGPHGTIARTGNTVSVLLGNGDGTFQAPRTFAAGSPDPLWIAVADFNGDGAPDVVVTNSGTPENPGNTVSVMLGNGDGTFQDPQAFAVGLWPTEVVVADLNGDGKPDLVVANQQSLGVSVLLNTTATGASTASFAAQETFTTGNESVAVADLNGDGKPDLVVASVGSSLSALPGNGDGTFEPQKTIANVVASFKYGWTPVAVADVNGDGKPDLVVASYTGIAVVLGNRDDTFQSPQAFAVGNFAFSGAVADVNGDGKPDVVVANETDNTVSILLGNGDGTIQPQKTFAVGSAAESVAVADLNGDGKPDLVTANMLDNTVSVLLGNGDGTFQTQTTFAVGSGPSALAVADVNGDGKPDLIIDNYHGNNVSVLLGNGDGTFQPQRTFASGTYSYSVTVADVNGDGKPDLVIDQYMNKTVSVLLGNGDGTFQPRQTISATTRSLAVADVNGDGKPDLIIDNYVNNAVSVLLGNGDGTFGPPQPFAAGTSPGAVAVADVNGDGKPDLVVANAGTYPSYSGSVSVLLGNGDGTFQPPKTFAVGVGSYPRSVVVTDLNGDGKPDLVTVNLNTHTVSVLLGNGDGTVAPAINPVSGVGSRNTPYLVDLTGDGTADSVVLDRSGNILFRNGLPGADNSYAPPVILNPGRPARDLTVLRTDSGWAIATADASFDPKLSSANHFVYTVSLYAVAADGTVRRTTAFSTTLLPTRIAAADLTGNGLGDLVVADSLDNTIQAALQQPDGTFSLPLTLATGEAPSDVALVDVSSDGLLDLVVTNQASGDVSVFLNDATHSFAQSYRFRAGTGLYGLDTTGASPAVISVEQSVSLAAGDFTGAGRNDLVVVNRGSDSFSVLANDGGGFANPQAAWTTSTSPSPGVNGQAGPVVAGDFNGDGNTDLAVLMEDLGQIWIYTSAGHGHFTHTYSVAAGSSPTGLALFRNPRTGLLDLLAGDPFGDVLHLQGKGDGTFQAPGSRVSLAVQDLSNGQPMALVADQQTDRVTVQAPLPGSPQFVPVVTLADGSRSTLAPGAVQWAKLDKGSPYFDAVVLASGGNAVLVYRGTGFDAAGQPTFAAPVSYPVGTDPVGLTIQDLNGDGIPDMIVANQGSNDVSILFGAYDTSGAWVATLGPRLKSGGQGPVATTLRDVNGDGIPDLVVTNSQSGTFTVLPGVGQGFFNDTNPQVLAVPGNPLLQAPSFVGISDQGVVATADGRLIGFDLADFAASVHTVFTPPTGQGVAVAEALANGDVVAALDGGAVVSLAPSNGGLVVDQVFQSETGIPSDPSALAVLQGESGQLVLVTNEGGDQVFVFGIPVLATPVPPPLASLITIPPPEAPAVAALEVTPPAGGLLTLVITQIAGPLPTAGGVPPADAPPAAGVSATSGPPAIAPAANQSAGGGTGDDDGVVHVADAGGDGGPRPGEEGIDLDERLRRIDLYPRTPDPDRKGPTTWQPDGPEQRGRPLVMGNLDRTSPPLTATDTVRPSADLEPGASWTVPAKLMGVEGQVADVTASAHWGERADAGFALPPETGDREHTPLLALALTGFAWWPRFDDGSERKRQQSETGRRSSRPTKEDAVG